MTLFPFKALAYNRSIPQFTPDSSIKTKLLAFIPLTISQYFTLLSWS